MKNLSITIFTIMLITMTADADEFQDNPELTPMIYYKIPLTSNSQLMKQGRRLGFSLNYSANSYPVTHQVPPFIEIAFTGNSDTSIYLNGIEVFNNYNKFYQDECTGNDCYPGAESHTGLIITAVIVSGVYLAHAITGETNF